MRTHLLGEIEAVVVDVGDDDEAGADVARDRRRHDADRPGAGDQHVLAYQVEGERGMRCIAEGIEDRRQVATDVVRDLERVEGGNGEIFGEGAGAVHADANGVAAKMPTPGAAVAAIAAGDVALAGDAVADIEALHLLAQGHDLADIFMANLHADGDGLGRPLVPFPDVDVGAADRGLGDLDEHVVMADFRLLDLGELEAGAGFGFDQGFHDCSTAVWFFCVRRASDLDGASKFIRHPPRRRRIHMWTAPVLQDGAAFESDRLRPYVRPVWCGRS